MGDIADEHMDRMFDEGEDDDGYGYAGYGYMRRNFHRVPSTVECKRCGKAGLFWQQDADGWYLQERDGYVHQCDEKRVHAGVINDFEVEAPPAGGSDLV